MNAEAVAKKTAEIARKDGVNVSFVLAGEKGLFSLEDFLCAGAIASEFPSGMFDFSDEALAAVLTFGCMKKSLGESVMKSRHARRLTELGFRRDVEFSCMLNRFSVVPACSDDRITLMQ